MENHPPKLKIVVVGGGAAGFFAAITCAEAAQGQAEVLILEKSAQFLSKVRISGGGRCNVTHACFNPRELATHYPRGERALIGPFSRFQPEDTIAWFQTRGVKLKTEADGRMFPTTNSSQTIIDCLLGAAEKSGVILRTQCGLEAAKPLENGGFELRLSTGESMRCDRLILASGGCRTMPGAALAQSLGHQIEPPVPSLFTFQINESWLNELAGISVEAVTAAIPAAKLSQTGPILVTHSGLSGPAILKLSAWGARALSERGYQFTLKINWLGERSAEAAAAALRSRSESQPAGLVVNAPIRPLPGRLWEQLVLLSNIPRQTRWGAFPKAQLLDLARNLTSCEFKVTGKSTNKAEFVTCGGVRLSEVNFKTMESKIVPGLYFAGELLDIDGVTGGFNFQAAWTTGWIAGSHCWE